MMDMGLTEVIFGVEALVDAGANLEAKTAAGTGINRLKTSRDVKKAIVSCSWFSDNVGSFKW
jgi:hypothetical protein